MSSPLASAPPQNAAVRSENAAQLFYNRAQGILVSTLYHHLLGQQTAFISNEAKYFVANSPNLELTEAGIKKGVEALKESAAKVDGVKETLAGAIPSTIIADARKATEMARSLDHTAQVLHESPTAPTARPDEKSMTLKAEEEKHEARMAALWEENADVMNQFTQDELRELSAIAADPLRYRANERL